MEDDPMEFVLDGNFVYPGIFPDPIGTDIDFPFNGLFRVGQVKTDDIGIVIVTKESLVDVE